MDRYPTDPAELLLTGALLSLYAGLRGSAWAVGALERAVAPARRAARAGLTANLPGRAPIRVGREDAAPTLHPHPLGLSWTMDETMLRSSHALATGRTGVADRSRRRRGRARAPSPPSAPPAGVVQLLDRHGRDGAAHRRAPRRAAPAPSRRGAGLARSRCCACSTLPALAGARAVVAGAARARRGRGRRHRPRRTPSAPRPRACTPPAALPPGGLRGFVPEHLLPGHGPPLHGPDAAEGLRAAYARAAAISCACPCAVLRHAALPR